LLALTACQLNRPGEVSPLRAAPGCAELETVSRGTDVEDLSPEQLEQLTYCHTAAAAESARATESHTDFLADMSYLGILLNVAAVVVAVIVAATEGP
jgi:hypothetical protein